MTMVVHSVTASAINRPALVNRGGILAVRFMLGERLITMAVKKSAGKYKYEYPIMYNEGTELVPISANRKINDGAIFRSELFHILKHRHIYRM